MKQYNKLQKDIEKAVKKFLKNTSLLDYLNNFNTVEGITYKDKDRNFVLTSSYYINLLKRKDIVNTLKAIDYQRGNQDWNQYTIIAYLQELLYLQITGSDTYEEDCETLSKRYNVCKDNLYEKVDAILQELDCGMDRYYVTNYFSIFDLAVLKFRNLQEVQKRIEDKDMVLPLAKIIYSYYLF